MKRSKLMTAAFFRSRQAVEQDGHRPGDHPTIQAYAEGLEQEALDPQLVVRELYQRYQRQLQRWADYRNLFLFLSFCALFLGVLYAQRAAQVAYKVHSTIESVVAPHPTTMQSTEEVYSWLQGLLETVWKDPICGDGICESPFEFSSYGRFGCRADCGMLSQVQVLTSIQLDLHWDFSHPRGSIPASELMAQASWNLCPQQTAFSGDCYFDSDQQFRTLSGRTSVVVDDAPDGSWELVIKRDIFNKVKGAVRDVAVLHRASFYQKAFVAAAAARAERDFEVSLLQSAINASSTRLLDYIWTEWQSLAAGKDAFDVQQLHNATCLCVNGTAPLNGTAGFASEATYLASYCSGTNELRHRSYNSSTNTTDELQASGAQLDDLCSALVEQLAKGRSNMTTFVQRALVDRRLGDGRLSGKVAQRNAVVNSLQRFTQATYPELEPLVFGAGLLGIDPLGDPGSCRVDVLAQLYVDGPTYSLTPAPANLELSRRKVYDPAVSLAVLAQRAQDRIAEVQGQAVEAAAIVLPAPLGSITLGELHAVFAAAGASSSTLPAQASPGLGQLSFSYDLASWEGNTTAYMQCALGSRAPAYIGTCQPVNVSCAATGDDSAPYSCTLPATNDTVHGNLSSVAYREECELPCDMQQDCAAVCECSSACGTNQACICDACMLFSGDAKGDAEFMSISSSASSSGDSTWAIAEVSVGARRRLLESNTTSEELQSNLTLVLSHLSDVRSQQSSLGGQMTVLQGQIDTANQLAVARAADTRVLDLVSASRADIASGQAALVARLDALLQKQQAALEAAASAAKALAAIEDLQSQQAQALQSLERAVQSQLYAIKVAASQNIITIGQALTLWKRARRDRALATKIATLANVPCSTAPTAGHEFVLDNGNEQQPGTSRERSIGLSNRVVGGLLITAWRSRPGSCASSKFGGIQGDCTGPASLAPYGVDPVFKRGASSYNPDLDDAEAALVRSFYNCSEIAEPLYNLTDPATNLTCNQPPLCAQLYNPRGLPWAFHHFPMAGGRRQGFPVWFDINLDAQGAQTWFTWLQEGLYLDEHTHGVAAELVTYNAELRVFGSAKVSFDFRPSGSIQASTRLSTLRVELYQSAEDRARLAAEVLLTMAVFVQLLVQLWQIAAARPESGSLLGYFASGWSWVDLASNALLAVCACLWWILVEQLTKRYQVALRYDVYASLEPQARFLRLSGDGEQLAAAVSAFNDLDKIVASLNWYYALNGINILLLIARVLRRLDFQPRLGVVTRSLARAGPDLLHFAVVFGMVFGGYSLMGHLIFGSSIEAFQDLASSVNTCFEMLLGNIDVNQELRELDGLQGAAGTLFFWSYMLLVFMVLLNFLLAIIVDAFSEVKAGTKEKVGLHTELGRLLAAQWRALTGRLGNTHISDRRLGLLLRSWAGEVGAQAQQQEQRWASREPTIQVFGEQLDAEAVKDILLACLDCTAAGTAGTGASAKGGTKDAADGLRGKLSPPSGRNQRVISEEELEAAAAQIVQRLAGVQAGMEQSGCGERANEQQQDERRATHEQVSALEAEREQLALALDRLAAVQRELAEGQRTLMASQRQLQEQQARMLGAMEPAPPSPNSFE